MASSIPERKPDDGREILPDLRLSDVLQQRPTAFKSPWQVARIAIAVTISWLVGSWLSPGGFAIFAPLTTLLVISASPWSTFGLSLQRILGTGVGVLLASLWVNWVGVSWWSVLIAVSVSLFIASRLPFSLGGQFQIPASVLFVFALGVGSWQQDLWRVIDVAIGGAIGVLAVYLPPTKPRPEVFEAALQSYRDRLLDVLELIAAECGTHPRPLGTDVMHDFVASSRQLRTDAEKARQALVGLAESITFNPRGRAVRAQLDDDALRLRRLSGMGMQVRGIAGAINKQYDRASITPALRPAELSTLLQQMADLGRIALGSPGAPVRTESVEQDLAAAQILEDRLRGVADSITHSTPGDVLESVSLLGRMEYVVDQMRGFDRAPGEDPDRFEED